jgi:hypothetical protein
MSLAFDVARLIRLDCQSQVDRGFLHGVQHGFGSSGVVSWAAISSVILFCLVLIAIIVLLRLWLRPAKYTLIKGRDDLITDPETIENILQRAADMRAVFDLEIMDEGYDEIYRGELLGINDQGQIEAAVDSYTDPNLTFEDKYATVAFRLSRRGEQEFYQFNTTTLYIGISHLGGRRTKALRLAMPKQMEKSQKRRFMRVGTEGDDIRVRFLGTDQTTQPMQMNGFRVLHDGQLRNVSVGGLEAVIKARPEELEIQPGDEVYVFFKLPQNGLGDPNLPKNVVARAETITVFRQQTGRRVMSTEAERGVVGPHIVRVMFQAKGRMDPAGKQITFRSGDALAFEDLARWIQAYQRKKIQEERDTVRRPDEVPNLYPRKPLRAPEKYPPIQLPKDESTEGPAEEQAPPAKSTDDSESST